MRVVHPDPVRLVDRTPCDCDAEKLWKLSFVDLLPLTLVPDERAAQFYTEMRAR